MVISNQTQRAVGALLATSDKTTQTISVEVTDQAGRKHTVTTERLEGEEDAAFVARHFAIVKLVESGGG